MEDAWLAEKEQRDLIQGLSDSGDRRMRSSRRPKRSRADKRVNQPARKKKQPEQGPKSALDAILDEPCAIHSVSLNTNPTHRLRACWVVRQVAKGGINLLDNLGAQKSRGKTPSWEEQSSDEDEILMIYETHPSRNQRKRALREINHVSHVITSDSRWLDTPITFGQDDQPTSSPSRGVAALVLDPIIDGYRLTKVLMDGGSSLNLIYEDTLQKMQFDKSRIEPSRTTFKGIIPGKEARCSGRVTLDVVFGTPDNYRVEELIFNIVPFRSGYHALLGRDAFARFHAIPHYAYMKLKMPGPNGVITVTSNADISLRAENKTAALALEAEAEALAAEELTALRATVDRDDVILDKRPKSTSFKPADEIVKFQVHPEDPSKMASIGARLDPALDEALRAFLQENWDIFAWHPSDMPGIPRNLAEHSLNIIEGFKPVKQALRRFSEPKRQAMGEELAKLLEAGFIREIKHPEWLANLVMVPKKDKSWRLCVDFKDVNKACPKDPFPLPRIDQIVDATAGHDLLCFLDAYSGYHQIKMRESDQAATAFITPYGPFCFNTMPFGLKNAGATYQRMIQTCLEPQIGKTVEAYVDDVVVKTRKANKLIDDLRETFKNLRAYNIKLNPEKCVFGVPSGKLLGFIVSHRGIEANPDKIKALARLEVPTELKHVQRLAGCVASLSRFIS